MEIQTISNMSFAIYLNDRDLRQRRIKPEQMSSEETTAILRSAFEQIGKTSWNKAYVDFYPGRNEMLLFVRLNFQDPLYFQFADFDDLLLAAEECVGNPFSSLTYIDGSYVLTVYPLEGETDPVCFSEFGTRLCYPAKYALYLAEHGREILAGNAVSALKEKFARHTV